MDITVDGYTFTHSYRMRYLLWQGGGAMIALTPTDAVSQFACEENPANYYHGGQVHICRHRNSPAGSSSIVKKTSYPKFKEAVLCAMENYTPPFTISDSVIAMLNGDPAWAGQDGLMMRNIIKYIFNGNAEKLPIFDLTICNGRYVFRDMPADTLFFLNKLDMFWDEYARPTIFDEEFFKEYINELHSAGGLPYNDRREIYYELTKPLKYEGDPFWGNPRSITWRWHDYIMLAINLDKMKNEAGAGDMAECA